MVLISSIAFFLFAFLLCAIVVVLAWMVTRNKSEQEEDEARRDSDEPDSTLFRSERLSDVDIWNNLLARFDFVEIMKNHIEQAQLDWSVGRVTSLMLLCGTIAGTVLAKASWAPAWAAVAGAMAAAWIPYGYVRKLRARRFRKFQEHFPDVLDSLSRALRAGYPLAASMEIVAGECQPPVAQEMRKTVTEANLGAGWKQALDNLARRVPLPEVNMFTAAVQLHARTGGKLSEVMGNLGEAMRESIALQGEVRAIAAHGKLTGLILTIVPVAIAIMMTMVAPGYMAALFTHPYGKHMLWAAVVCLVLAHFLIRKIVDLKI
jgi:tight adherence protein B